MEEEEEAKSESGENEVVSRFTMLEREEEPKAHDLTIVRINVNVDVR